jgi:hypothetical protein
MAESYNREWQLATLRESVAIWNMWRTTHPEMAIDLSKADLSEADLSRVDLRGEPGCHSAPGDQERMAEHELDAQASYGQRGSRRAPPAHLEEGNRWPT